jgi:hypothetical protein
MQAVTEFDITQQHDIVHHARLSAGDFSVRTVVTPGVLSSLTSARQESADPRQLYRAKESSARRGKASSPRGAGAAQESAFGPLLRPGIRVGKRSRALSSAMFSARLPPGPGGLSRQVEERETRIKGTTSRPPGYRTRGEEVWNGAPLCGIPEDVCFRCGTITRRR